MSQKYFARHTKPCLTRHETCWIMLECHELPRLPRETTFQPVLKPSTRRGFAASPIDTATAPESQRLKTRHVGASKRAFRTRLPQISHFASSKSTFSYEFSYMDLPQNRHLVRGFHQFSSHVTKCHACHAKRSDATLEMSKSDPFFCRTYHRHGHSDRARTVAEHLANTAQPPHPQSETGTLATHSGKISVCVFLQYVFLLSVDRAN